MKSLTLVLLPAVVALAACAANPMMAMSPVHNDSLPEAVRAPAGTMQTMFTIGTGELTYECREKKDMAGMFEWGVVGPVATLKTKAGEVVGKYYAGPTWESVDGSKVTGKQVAVAPNGAGNIPMQLVKADPAVPRTVWARCKASATSSACKPSAVSPRYRSSRSRHHCQSPVRRHAPCSATSFGCTMKPGSARSYIEGAMAS